MSQLSLLHVENFVIVPPNVILFCNTLVDLDDDSSNYKLFDGYVYEMVLPIIVVSVCLFIAIWRSCYTAYIILLDKGWEMKW